MEKIGETAIREQQIMQLAREAGMAIKRKR